MELNTLYNIVEKENIKIYDYYIDDVKGMYCQYDNFSTIAMNYNNINTAIEEKCILA